MTTWEQPSQPNTLRSDGAIDLHTHTTASDGMLSPAELVRQARRRGIGVLGVTDHDTLDGLPEARVAAREAGIDLVPGVELSTTIPGPEIHILGYFVNPDDPVFIGRLAALASDRVNRITNVVRLLNNAGYPIDLGEILAQADEGSIGRPHVARALIELGAATDMNDAFSSFLKRGTVGWSPRSPFTAEEAVRMLLDNGAVPVLAHPYSTKDVEGTVARLVPSGLQGLEVYYGEYTDDQQQELLRTAHRNRLTPTGGSDFHGPRFREGRDLGTVTVPISAWEQLQALGLPR
ncbi:MAG: PHP domain-containing protein [Chloroflexota bacterium]|nr:PHP domain-containing protein [Chloroflexota bacterium]